VTGPEESDMRILLAGVVGSVAYGLNGPDSDVDRLGVFTWPTDRFMGLTAPSDSIVTSKPDSTMHEAAKAARLMLAANPTVTELLWLEDYESKAHQLGDELVGIRSAFLSAKRVRDAYMGYAVAQFRKLLARGDGSFNSDIPARRASKHARHLKRLVDQGFELYTTGRLTIRLENPQAYFDFGEQVAKDPESARPFMAEAERRFDDARTVLPPGPGQHRNPARSPAPQCHHQTKLDPEGPAMLDLAALNSATKYPSIPTYHELGDRGSLTETVTPFHGDVILTEKIDGTNSRIIITPDADWYIGSREELLTARGDRVHNPALGIVDALRDVAPRLTGDADERILVAYLETYGARIGGEAKQYSTRGAVGWRLFDLAFIPAGVLGWERERIAAWRDGGGQKFAHEETMQRAALSWGIERTPRLGTIPAGELPISIEDTHAWLTRELPGTLAALDESAGGRAEGIVLRTVDRSVIAKARFQDYERTLKRRGTQQGKRAAAIPA